MPPASVTEPEHENKTQFTAQIELSKYKDDYILVLFLKCFKTKVHKATDDFPGYFNYEFGIYDTNRYFKEIIKQGYLEPAGYSDILKLYTVSDLKMILADFGLPQSGKKDILIDRILNNVPEASLPMIDDEYYRLSEKGKGFMLSHEYYLTFRQKTSEWDLNFDVFFAYMLSQNLSFEDSAIHFLSEHIARFNKDDAEHSNYIFYKLNDFYKGLYSLFYTKEDYEKAMLNLLKCVLLSLSGAKNAYLAEYGKYMHLSKAQVLDLFEPAKIDSYIASELLGNEEYYKESLCDKAYLEFIGAFNLCQIDEFKEIVLSIFNSYRIDLDDYNHKLLSRFEKLL